MKTKIEIISCPGCLKYQEAEAKFLDTGASHGWLYAHQCKCGYLVMGDDWVAINAVDELNMLEKENEQLRNCIKENWYGVKG